MSMTEERLFSFIDERVEPIFHYWTHIHQKRTSTVLDPKRVARIEWALKHYSVVDIRKAIRGCALSPWHMGHNPRNKKYNDIELILRDASHVDQFIDVYETEDTAERELEAWLNE